MHNVCLSYDYVSHSNKVCFVGFHTCFLKNIYYFIFIFGRAGSWLLCMGFLQLLGAEATLCCSVQASHGCSFSHCGAWALGAWAAEVAAQGL